MKKKLGDLLLFLALVAVVFSAVIAKELLWP